MSSNTGQKCTSNQACISNKCYTKCTSSVVALSADCGCGITDSNLKLAKLGDHCLDNVV